MGRLMGSALYSAEKAREDELRYRREDPHSSGAADVTDYSRQLYDAAKTLKEADPNGRLAGEFLIRMESEEMIGSGGLEQKTDPA